MGRGDRRGNVDACISVTTSDGCAEEAQHHKNGKNALHKVSLDEDWTIRNYRASETDEAVSMSPSA